ncbi:MAG: oligosaccharide flippase family protein [Verrucomicrobiae bacterium]|nr:oligosaccharide flippase family protein [Verrucomicrobiae bacterium]
MSETRKFWGAGVILLAASFSVNIATFLQQAVQTRWLSDDDFGALKWAMDWLSYVGTPVGALHVAMTRYTAVFDAQANAVAVASLAWRATRRLAWYAGAFVAFVVVAHAWLVRGFRLEQKPGLLWVVAALIVMQLAVPVTMSLLQGLQRFGWLAATSVVSGWGRLVFGLALVIAGYGAVGALSGQLLAVALGTALSLWALRALWHHRRADHSALDTRPIYKYFWPALVVTFSFGTIGLVDTSFVRHYFEQDISGQYGKAKLIAQAFGYLVMPLSAVLFPKAAGDAARGGTGALRALWQAIGVAAFVGVAAALACTWLPWLPVRILAGDAARNQVAVDIVAPFVWAMLPLGLAALPLQFFLARAEFRPLLVPLAVLVVAYPAALWLWHESLLQILAVLAAAGTVALSVLLWSLRHVGR